MNVAIFDTETISLNKPFCYNVGYVIYNTDIQARIHAHDFVVSQVWDNRMLFETAHYANKRPLYITAMRIGKAHKKKFGNVCRHMTADFKKFNVKYAYAYNSNFDEKVFNFNCQWFKCHNPFDTLPVIDIAGNVCETIAKRPDYNSFCEKYKLFTENGNYSMTAENVYRYVKNNPDFQEDHTALSDSEIECEILQHTLNAGCTIGANYARHYLIRNTKRQFVVTVDEHEKYSFDYIKKVSRDTGIFLYTK